MILPTSRFRRAAWVAGLALLVAVAPDAAPPRSTPSGLFPAASPGAPAPGLKYFRIDPHRTDNVYRMLVIPVRFPENPLLGGGEREGLEARLTGSGEGTLEGFYETITFNQMRLRVTLAPTVVTEHPRTWYTSEGEGNRGFGLDVDAYPHNSRGLIEEVTGKITESVDLRRYDNTGDGIADGLLILHSGPSTPEVITSGMSPSLLPAHSFTLDQPVLRSDSWIFPYAVASTSDLLGPWAHEVGHLFGLVDLYVPNSFCPGEGLGAWSLMATGANQNDGADPTGLDAFSLQLLGFPPVVQESPAEILTLGSGTFLRFFKAGLSEGPEYFLVERRVGEAEPGLTDSVTVIYSVDESMVDNRTCGRPLVEVRGVIGPETTGPVVLDDATDPSLLDRNGEATNLWLWLDGARAVPATGSSPTTKLVRARLLAPRPGAPGNPTTQRIDLIISNLYPLSLPWTEITINGPDGAGLCVSAPGGNPMYSIPVGGMVRDTSWVIQGCDGADLPAITAPFEVVVGHSGTVGTLRDTLFLAVNQSGLAADRLDEFEAVNLAPGRGDPWRWEGDARAWAAEDLGVRADAEIRSPWFSVPEHGVLIFDHEWDLDAVAADLALDAAVVRLETQITADRDLHPLLGWGHSVERGVGNALGGREALSGSGSRVQVLDLSDHAGETVRVKFRAAGDVEAAGGLWRIRRVEATSSGVIGQFRLATTDGRNIRAVPVGDIPEGTQLILYSGPVPLNTGHLLAGTTWSGEFTALADGEPGARRRFDLVWLFADGGGGSDEIIVDLPSAPLALLPPHPNPLRSGQVQTWNLEVAVGTIPGVYHFLLVDAAGRRVVEKRARFDLLGRRALTWDGRDFAGRRVPAGVYFLRMRTPGGHEESRRVVVLP